MQQYSPEEKPDAFVRHQIEGRLRLRVPGRRGDDGFFRRVTSLLAGIPQIQSFATNPLTGSILIKYGGSAEPVLVAMAELIRLVPAPAPASARRITVPGRSPTLHPLSAAAIGFAALAGVQLLRRGPMAGSATENFWNAYGALRRK